MSLLKWTSAGSESVSSRSTCESRGFPCWRFSFAFAFLYFCVSRGHICRFVLLLKRETHRLSNFNPPLVCRTSHRSILHSVSLFYLMFPEWAADKGRNKTHQGAYLLTKSKLREYRLPDMFNKYHSCLIWKVQVGEEVSFMLFHISAGPLWGKQSGFDSNGSWQYICCSWFALLSSICRRFVNLVSGGKAKAKIFWA